MSRTPRTADAPAAAAGPVPARFTLVALDRLFPHESVLADRAREMTARLRADAVVRQPIVVDAGTGVVVDGHHRLAALHALGATRAPAYEIDYTAAALRLEAWDAGAGVPSKTEVLERALKGDLFPPKTTRHPDVYTLPPRPTPLADLGVPDTSG